MNYNKRTKEMGHGPIEKHKASTPKSNWGNRFFRRDYIRLYKFPLQRTQQEVNFLVRMLNIKKGAAILDLCCGSGRHSIELAKKGFDVTGVDFSQPLLAEAKMAAINAHLNVPFIRKDMRRITFVAEYDVVINLFTSFGYFNDRDNESVIAAVARALKPGGKFVLDIVNKKNAIASVSQQAERKAIEGGYMLRSGHYDPSTNILTETRTVVIDNRRKTHKIPLRLYSLEEISSILQRHSLNVVIVFGGYDGSTYTLSSPRMIVIAEKA